MGGKFAPFFLALTTTLLLFLGVGVWWFWANGSASSDPKAEQQTFIVRKGESVISIAENLKRDRLIKSAVAFRILVISQNLSGKIQAGSFKLKPTLTPAQIGEIFTHGTNDIWIIFPEGWRKEEYGRRLAANLTNFDYKIFLDLTENLEGKLFPDTYLFPKEATPALVVTTLTANFDKKTLGLDITPEKLILASLVEREIRRDEERRIVAGILLKRLKNGWPLQVDATVQYVVANVRCGSLGSRGNFQCDWWQPLRSGDLEIKSPYNTYKLKGLPPTPIANPGLASIKAAVNPQDSDYWYYLSDRNGETHYAKTVEEHNKNIQEYLR